MGHEELFLQILRVGQFVSRLSQSRKRLLASTSLPRAVVLASEREENNSSRTCSINTRLGNAACAGNACAGTERRTRKKKQTTTTQFRLVETSPGFSVEFRRDWRPGIFASYDRITDCQLHV